MRIFFQQSKMRIWLQSVDEIRESTSNVLITITFWWGSLKTRHLVTIAERLIYCDNNQKICFMFSATLPSFSPPNQFNIHVYIKIDLKWNFSTPFCHYLQMTNPTIINNRTWNTLIEVASINFNGNLNFWTILFTSMNTFRMQWSTSTTTTTTTRHQTVRQLSSQLA